MGDFYLLIFVIIFVIIAISNQIFNSILYHKKIRKFKKNQKKENSVIMNDDIKKTEKKELKKYKYCLKIIHSEYKTYSFLAEIVVLSLYILYIILLNISIILAMFILILYIVLTIYINSLIFKENGTKYYYFDSYKYLTVLYMERQDIGRLSNVTFNIYRKNVQNYSIDEINKKIQEIKLHEEDNYKKDVEKNRK